MTRFHLASLVAGLAALSAFADGPPTAMPGGTPAPKPSVAPWPTTPTVPPPMLEATTESGERCGCRCGIFCRLSALWSGRRYAYIEPSQCSSVQSSSPIYCSYECSRARLGERGHRFGFGRFMEGEDREGHSGCLARLKAFLCWRPAPYPLHCMAEPYSTPIRYYFKPLPESEGGNSYCTNGRWTGPARGGLTGGGLAGGGRIIGRAEDGGVEQGSDGMRERGRLGGGLATCRAGSGCGNGVTRVHRYSDGIDGGVHGFMPHSHHGEGCYDLPGSTFQGNIRFAKNEKQAVPAIDASRPGDLPADWQKIYSQKPETPPAVQQASLAVPQR